MYLIVVGMYARTLKFFGKWVCAYRFTDEVGKLIMINVFHAAIVYNCEYSGGTDVTIIKMTFHVVHEGYTISAFHDTTRWNIS